MKIGNIGNVGGSGKTGKSKSAGDGGFSKFLDSAGGAQETASVGAASRVSAVNVIQALAVDEQSKRRKLVEDADDLLDELLKIRDALLLGNVSAEQLRVIQRKLEKIEADCDDPRLNEIIEETKIRAAVELAKLGYGL